MVEGPAPPPPHSPSPQVQPPRVPRTHTNPEVIEILQRLPFFNKLQTNKCISEENQTRLTKKLNHALNGIKYPDDGSDVALLITVDESNMNDLLDDSIREQYKDVLPISVVKWIADTKKANGESHSLKRSSDGDTSKKLVSKRRCMDGNSIVARSIEELVTIHFPQILFDTESSVAVPLSFSTHKNLQYICKNLGTIERASS
ncbi:hypothetical protein HYPSUDRAFT_132991, partial [Hypholoma sublateritium FD-334 SS-4]